MYFKKLTALLALLLLFTGLVAACGDATNTAPATTSLASANTSATTTGAAPAPANKIKVVATTTQVGDFVKNVGGNRVEVFTIVKPGADAHEYEPTAEDSRSLAAAQVVFQNGLGLDSWLEKTIQSSGTKASVVNASQGAKTRNAEGKEADEFKDGDPHIWFNTSNAKKMVDNIAAGLAKADATGASTYQSNATAYKVQIDEMAKQVKGQIDGIPAAQRKLVTNHDAFGYFIEEFGLTFVGSVVPSLDSTAEPSAREIQQLVAKIKEQNVKAIFTEESINPKLAEQVSKEAGVKIFSNLYGDSLGAPGSEGDTYIKMMLSNGRNIANGLK